MEFDGLDTQVVVPDDASIQNIFDGGGAAEVLINARSDGGGNDGHILRKNTFILWTDLDDGTNYRLKFQQGFSTTAGAWQTDTNLPLNETIHVAVIYNSDSTSNDPTIFINGVPRTVGDGLTETSTPAGTRTSDSSNDLYISNRPCCGGDRAFDGWIDEVAVYSATVPAPTVALHAYEALPMYASAVRKDAPVGYWRLGETSGNAIDISGNGNNGTVTLGGGSYDADGLLVGETDGSLMFDGADTKVSIAAATPINNIFDGGGAVEFVINPESAGENSAARIVNKSWQALTVLPSGDTYSLDFDYGFSTAAGKWRVSGLPLNETTHVVIVYDNSSASNDPVFWIDGEPMTVGNGVTEELAPSGTRNSDAATNITIGNIPASSRTFDGRIDEVALYATPPGGQAIAQHAFQALQQYSSLALEAEPVGYWRLGESSGSALDSSGNGNQGTVTIGSGTRDAEALVDDDGSIDFDGQDAQVLIPDDAVLQNIFDGGGTIEAWINPRSDGGLDDGHIIRKSPWILIVDQDDGTYYSLKFHYYHSTTNGTWVTDVRFPLNETAHVAVVYDADSVNNNPTIYVDGEALTVGNGLTETSSPVGTRNTDVGYDLYISNRPCCGGDVAFDGRIDEVSVYNVALSNAAIRRHRGTGEQYDDLYRLIGVGTDEYTYDAVGNRLTMRKSGTRTKYVYDAADRLTSVIPTGGSTVSYTWDDNGNLTARGSDSFGWDAADRLISATVSSDTTTFAYNGDGLRDSVTADSVTTTYTWDVNRSIPQVIDDEEGGFVYGVGRILKNTPPSVEGDTFHYLTDGLGSVLRFGTLEYPAYDVFGAPPGVEVSIPVTNDFRFAGEQKDPTGLYYLRARYYDPVVGRFVSRDPLASSVEWQGHHFAYAANNPVLMVDPLGLYEGNEYEQKHCGAKGNPLEQAWNATMHGGACRTAVIAKEKALTETAARYGDEWGDHTPGGAFRHCYWSGLMALYLGADGSKTFGDLHEADDPNSLPAGFDYYNNAVGRLVGEKYRTVADFSVGEQLIADACYTLADRNSLITYYNDLRVYPGRNW